MNNKNQNTCTNCGGTMKIGAATLNYLHTTDGRNYTTAVEGRKVKCLKCVDCGHSYIPHSATSKKRLSENQERIFTNVIAATVNDDTFKDFKKIFDLTMLVEEKFDCTLPDDKAGNIKSVAELRELLIETIN